MALPTKFFKEFQLGCDFYQAYIYQDYPNNLHLYINNTDPATRPITQGRNEWSWLLSYCLSQDHLITGISETSKLYESQKSTKFSLLQQQAQKLLDGHPIENQMQEPEPNQQPQETEFNQHPAKNQMQDWSQPTEPNQYRVLVNEDSEAVFLIGDDSHRITANFPSYFIERTTFEKVEYFVKTFKIGLDALIQKSEKPGTLEYWEKNYHDQITKLLVDLIPGVNRSDVSNSLSALGY